MIPTDLALGLGHIIQLDGDFMYFQRELSLQNLDEVENSIKFAPPVFGEWIVVAHEDLIIVAAGDVVHEFARGPKFETDNGIM